MIKTILNMSKCMHAVGIDPTKIQLNSASTCTILIQQQKPVFFINPESNYEINKLVSSLTTSYEIIY